MASTKKVKIELWDPHEGQQFIMEKAKRFNVIVCARRFGKTELMISVDLPLIAPAVFDGQCIGIFTPVKKDFTRQWETIKKIYEPLIAKVDNSKMIIWFHGGGEIYVWSLANDKEKNNGRGWPFYRVIYEETQKIPDAVLDHHWKEAIRPTLTDYQGDAWFIGTANGKGNQWFEFARRGANNGECSVNSDGQQDLPPYSEESYQDWVTFRMITTDNPGMPQGEVDGALEDMDLQSWLQEYFSHFIDYTGNMWAYSLEDQELRNKIVTEASKIEWRTPIHLAFDFNKVPMTCVLMQKEQLARSEQILYNYKYGVHFKKSFKLGNKKKGRQEEQQKTIFDICEAIRQFVYQETGEKIGKWTYTHPMTGDKSVEKYVCRFPIYITGDASGNVTSGMLKDPLTYYNIIETELGVSSSRIVLPKKNPYLEDSWAKVNLHLQKCPSFIIDKTNCKDLIADLSAAKDDGKHGIKKASGEQESHLVDCFRYAINSFCKDIRI